MSNRRLPAEWEPQKFVQYTFPHPNSDWSYMYEEVVDCFTQLIKTTAQFVPVLVVCHDKEEVSKYFDESTNIHFFEAPSNDTWARDHGAITVLDGDKPTLLDFTFNGWGGKFPSGLDDKINRKLKNDGVFKDEVVSSSFILEGGAIESDGMGTLLTTAECLLSDTRNYHFDEDAIEMILGNEFGLEQILWLDDGFLAGDDTDSHIDTLARFCNPTTIAYVKCDDAEDEHFEALAEMEAQLKTFTDLEDQPYNLVPLPWPEACHDEDGQRLPATYANFLITNGAVLVPTYRVPQDEEAVKVLQGCFPDRKVIGVDCRPLIEQHGSLHCVTMQFPSQINVSFL